MSKEKWEHRIDESDNDPCIYFKLDEFTKITAYLKAETERIHTPVGVDTKPIYVIMSFTLDVSVDGFNLSVDSDYLLKHNKELYFYLLDQIEKREPY